MSPNEPRAEDSIRRHQPGQFTAATPRYPNNDNGLQSAASSPSGSRHSRNGENDTANDEPQVPDPASPTSSFGGSSAGNSSQHRSSWRRSGGFLLSSSGAHRGDRTSMHSEAPHSPPDPKGKRKSVDKGLIVQKHRRARDQRSSYESSPLAKEVKTDNASGTLRRPTRTPDRAPSPWSDSSHAGSSSLHASPQSTQTSAPPSIGFDSDPSQIVNMALALSEGRRRYFSNSRPLPNVTGKPLLESTPLAQNARRQSSLGQYMQPQRQSSRNKSPKYRNVSRKSTRLPSNLRQTPAINHGQDESNIMAAEDLEDLYDVSNATWARVEKAKERLELLYEYRRLLQHLPPIRPSGTDMQRVSGLEPHSGGRAYNPLQYVRNRKLRFREKQPIPSDKEGWCEIEKVRPWVDAVADGHNDDRSDPNACVRLPQLRDRRPADADGAETPDGQPSRQDKTIGKPRRPRLDWIVEPGDLLADAFWLEQGLNKTKIEDHDGNKIYADNAPLKFTGRSVEPPRSEDLPAPDVLPLPHPSKPVRHSALPHLPSFQPAGRSDDRREHKRKILRNPIARDRDDSGSRSRKKKRKGLNILTRSVSKTSSDTLSGDEIPRDESPNLRGRQRKQRNKGDKRDAETFDLEKEMQIMRQSPSEDEAMGNFTFPSDRISMTDSPRELQSETLERSDTQNGSGDFDLVQQLQQRGSWARHTDEEAKPRNSYDNDTTAPSSPVANGFPSIAINLSPPVSRSPSPTRKLLPNPISFFRHDRSKSQDRIGISTADFASMKPSPTHSRSPSLDPPRRSTLPSPMDSREQSPFSKRSNTMPEEPAPIPAPLRHTQSALGKNASKSNGQEASSRIKGIFKGGRIAELVGNEVSRVGDFIWKRDAPSAPSSVASDTEPSADEMVMMGLGRGKGSQGSQKDLGLSRQNTATGRPKPQYHMSNLPTFTSPFKKDQDEREKQMDQERQSSLAPQSEDLASPASRRESTMSDRFQRLMPPKLDMTRNSSTDDLQKAGGDDESRRSSVFGHRLSLVESHDLRGPLIGRNRNMPVTGLHNIPSSKSPNRLNSRSASIHPVVPAGPVSIHEIARVRALLLTSALKAREISRRANMIREKPPQFLVDALNNPDNFAINQSDTLFPTNVHRKDEPLTASKNLLQNISQSSDSIRVQISEFTTSQIPDLHRNLQSLEDLLETTLIPRVRSAADSAGEVTQGLTTTSTLAVKRINDSIDQALRRRRRGMFGGERLFRRMGWGMVEGMVVGVLWVVWGVVSVVRLFKGIVGLFWGVFLWLFALD